MADNKVLNTRVQQKHDTEANWNKATSFTPKIGEVIVYDPDANYEFPRIKIGDGSTRVIDLPFVYEPIFVEDINEICGVSLVYGDEVRL